MTDTDQATYLRDQAHGWKEIGAFHHEYDRNPGHMRPETADGPGSTLALTEGLREWLSELLRRNKIDSMLDAACGDWAWMRLVNFGATAYEGWDVDEGRVDTCRRRILDGDCIGEPVTKFEVVNLLTVPEIPHFDLVVARDFFMHITNEHIASVLDKVHASGSILLLASTFPGADNSRREWNPERATWTGYMEAPADLSAAPFNLGEPLERFAEAAGPWGILAEPRELGLWRINEP